MSEHQFKDLKQKTTATPAQEQQTTPIEADGVVELQRYVGNQAVQRMLAEGRLTVGGQLVQAKMQVGPANDSYEKEADQVASSVMRQIQRAPQEDELQGKRDVVQRAGEEDEMIQGKLDPIQRAGEEDEMIQGKLDPIQRAGEEDEMIQGKRDAIQRAGEEDEMIQGKLDIQRAGGEEGFEVGGDIESTIQAARGSGSGLPDQTRGAMEGAFGQDFSGVKVHTDTQSDELNQSISARAFTTGQDIFFRQGEYNPGSSAGQELLAHELTHVVQQGGSSEKSEDKA